MKSLNIGERYTWRDSIRENTLHSSTKFAAVGWMKSVWNALQWKHRAGDKVGLEQRMFPFILVLWGYHGRRLLRCVKQDYRHPCEERIHFWTCLASLSVNRLSVPMYWQTLDTKHSIQIYQKRRRHVNVIAYREGEYMHPADVSFLQEGVGNCTITHYVAEFA